MGPGMREALESVESKNILDSWDEIFGLDFFAFRSELDRISKANLASVHDATVTVGLQDFSSWYRTDEDEMIYPIDDDDYFHPGLASTAPEEEDATALVFWPHVQYTYLPNGSPGLTTLPLQTLLTNNWGVRKSFLKRQFAEEDARQILSNHALAASEIASALGIERPAQSAGWWAVPLRGDSIRFLSSSYGLSLKHVGSLLRLLRAVENDDVAALAGLHFAEAADVPGELAWAEPWIRQAECVFVALGA
jgi:hypothetical protein